MGGRETLDVVPTEDLNSRFICSINVLAERLLWTSAGFNGTLACPPRPSFSLSCDVICLRFVVIWSGHLAAQALSANLQPPCLALHTKKMPMCMSADLPLSGPPAFGVSCPREAYHALADAPSALGILCRESDSAASWLRPDL